jgi:hypothetical protein
LYSLEDIELVGIGQRSTSCSTTRRLLAKAVEVSSGQNRAFQKLPLWVCFTSISGLRPMSMAGLFGCQRQRDLPKTAPLQRERTMITRHENPMVVRVAFRRNQDSHRREGRRRSLPRAEETGDSMAWQRNQWSASALMGRAGHPPFGSTQVSFSNLVKRENFELAGTSSVRNACATGTETSVLNLGSPEVQRNERKQRTYGPRIGTLQCRGLTEERCRYWGFSPGPNGPENGFYGGHWRRERNWVPTFSTQTSVVQRIRANPLLCLKALRGHLLHTAH